MKLLEGEAASGFPEGPMMGLGFRVGLYGGFHKVIQGTIIGDR